MLNILHKYADLILNVGVNLQKGQGLLIEGDSCLRDFALIIAEKAYQIGASAVDFHALDPRFDRLHIDYAKEEHLNFISPQHRSTKETVLANNWARIILKSNEFPYIYKDVSISKMQQVEKNLKNTLKYFWDSLRSGIFPWCMVPVPSDAWAKQVLNVSAKAEDLWEILIPILKLNEDNPSEYWLQQCKKIRFRSLWLNEKRFDYLKFKNTNTNLKVGLMRESNWLGGSMETPRNQAFLCNIPTEEVYTTPDFRRTEGFVKCTKPLNILGQIVDNLFLEFYEGALVKYSATNNIKVFETEINQDPQAKYLGEVALVDNQSSISNTKLFFHDILLDENASSHIALGFGHSNCLKNYLDFSTAERVDKGLNISTLHKDIMIGDDDIDVIGVDIKGKTYDIMHQGMFVGDLA